MFAVYATHSAPDDPLAASEDGEQPKPNVPEGWVRGGSGHASLNRHDIFALRSERAPGRGIAYPIIVGNNTAGNS